jgi:hypothetical protein
VVIEDIFPQAKQRLSEDLLDKANERTKWFTSFFKTPEQQMMPLGFFAMTEDMRNVNVLKNLREKGILMVHLYSRKQTVKDALGDINAAKSAGISVLQNLPSEYLKTGSSLFWQEHISQLAQQQQIIAWYLPEETNAEDFPWLRSLADNIRKTDSSHRPLITYYENGSINYLQQAIEIVDVSVFGAYPTMTPWRPRADIRKRIDRLYESGCLVGLAALEALQSREYFTKPEYVRFDAYLSLISGAKGIMWYSWNQARQSSRLSDAIFDVTMELNGTQKLGEVLLDGQELPDVRCRLVRGSSYAPAASAYENKSSDKREVYASLQWTTRQYENSLYIFAVNMNQAVGGYSTGGREYSLEVKFENLPVVIKQAEVISENRTVYVREASFSDSFNPLEVHIYKINLN